jgi:lysophospholipase L1-like esterase
LMIGTNDVNVQVDVANAPKRLGLLLDRISQGSPNALLVVAQIVPTTTDATNTRVQAYNAAIPALITERKAAGKHVVLVDMYGAFTSNSTYKSALMNDELHPNDAGHAVLAGVWWDAVGALLPH